MSRSDNTGTAPAGVKTVVRDKAAAMDAFDRLPKRLRDRLNEACFDFDPVELEAMVADRGLAHALFMLAAAEAQIARAIGQ